MLELLSNKSQEYQNKILKSLKINMISPETLKLITWNDYVKINLIFKENDLYSNWKIEFWGSFFDPFNRGIIQLEDFTKTCAYLSEQSKRTDDFLKEKTVLHVRDLLKNYFDENDNLNLKNEERNRKKRDQFDSFCEIS